MRAVRRPSVTFRSALEHAWEAQQTLLCVGLDPIPSAWPAEFPQTPTGAFAFCRGVVDAVADLVCAFKPQAAHFGALGAENELAALIRYIHDAHPDVPVILDAKRGDIGSTAERYAVEVFERYDADAVTVNPYLGPESLAAYLAHRERGVFVLCRTSNPGSDWLQGYGTPDEPVYLRVARAAAEWNVAGNVMLVTGATYPAELARIRSVVTNMPLLVPGIGTQGGEIDAVLESGLDANRRGLVFNVSRAVLNANGPDGFAKAVRATTLSFRDAIEHSRRSHDERIGAKPAPH
jgi:orotidine-5'-phosphate decarboxylase